MKNSIELRQDRAELIGKADSMLNLAKDETRDFTNDEQVSYDGMMKDIDKLAKDIQVVERQEKLNAEISASPVSHSVQNDTMANERRDYSLFKAVNGLMNNNLSGLEKEMHEEAIQEARSTGATINGIGIPSSLQYESRAGIVSEGSSSIAPTTLGAFQDGLREAAVYEQVGATVLDGLAANTEIPVVGANSAAYIDGENANAADVGNNFSSITLSPKRIGGFVDLSKQLMMQVGTGAEAAIVRDLGRSIGEAMNAAMFKIGNVSGADQSIGEYITNTVTPTSFAAGSTVADMLTMEEALAEAKGLQGNLAYVVNPVNMKEIRTGALVSSISAVQDSKAGFNGYPIVFSTGCEKRAAAHKDSLAIFGDFSKLYVGNFGVLDVMVDPYTQGIKGAVRLVLNKYASFGVSSAASFVKCHLKHTA